MDIFRRKGANHTEKKSPGRSPKSTKHSKIQESWGENKDSISDGVTFYLKYIGSTLLDEIEEEGRSYGEGQSSEAVKTIVQMAKATGNKKLRKMALTVSPRGIKVIDLATKEIHIDVSIYRINFCTADSTHDKVFAFIARNTTNETMECQAYLCPKRKIAQAVTLTVAKAFNVAYEEWESAKERKQNENVVRRLKESSPSRCSTGTPDSLASESTASLPDHIDVGSCNGHSTTSSTGGHSRTSSAGGGQQWVTFDDDVDDCFSKLAQVRVTDQQPYKLGTNLNQEDINGLNPFASDFSSDFKTSPESSSNDLLLL